MGVRGWPATSDVTLRLKHSATGPQTDSPVFAWAQALRKTDDEAEVKAWVLGVLTDEVIIDGLQSRQQQPDEPSG